MLRMLSRLIAALLVALALGPALAVGAPMTQIDPAVRDRVLPAAVQIAIIVETTENGAVRPEYVPVGSGTIVSPQGLILTNWHVVDMAAHHEQLQAWEAQADRDGVALTLDLDATQVLVLGAAGGDVPEPLYRATVLAGEQALDVAVLQITAHADGRPLDPASLALPSVPLGDAAALRQGDPVHLFAYPALVGGTLQYTAGVVSGFRFEQGVEGRAWITTDATMAGGSSGGTAVDAAGRLIGVPTQGSQLDCRPGDTNRDGRVDAADVGCIPVGGSFGELRPINLARDLLAGAGLDSVLIDASAQAPAATTVATAVPAPDMPPTPVAVDVANEADALIDATSPDAASYVFAEDYCRTGPVYAPGTRMVLPRDVGGFLERRLGFFIPAGTEVEITGPYIEDGVCDAWPIRDQEGSVDTLVDEWDLSPEFPNQVPPLPPERQFITREMEAFCLSDPDINTGTAMALAHDAPLFSYHRGYPFEFRQTIPAGTEIEITGPPVETGVCDMWRVTASWPNPDYIPPSEPPPQGQTVAEAVAAGTMGSWGESDEEIAVGGYIFEPDLRPEGR
jgi:hypothetical protein